MIIDIGGVLVHDRLIETVGRWARQVGTTQAELLAAIYGGNDDAVRVGRVSEDAWWEVVRDRLGIDTSRLRAELESGQTWDCELIAVLRDVKATTRTAILSNAWPSQRSRMVALDLADLVHELLLSCEIGYAKPNVNAFKVALERLTTDPARTLFVDDTPGHVDAAARLGMRVHLHSTTQETIKAIRQFWLNPERGDEVPDLQPTISTVRRAITARHIAPTPSRLRVDVSAMAATADVETHPATVRLLMRS